VIEEINKQFNSNLPLINEELEKKDKKKTEEIISMINDIIDHRIRPILQRDGGDL